jgi:hypothetical protein
MGVTLPPETVRQQISEIRRHFSFAIMIASRQFLTLEFPVQTRKPLLARN